MPSQEDYLDQLLKKIEEDDILKKMVQENATIEDVLSDTDMMSETQIDQILAENSASKESDEALSVPSQDLMSMLNDSKEEDLQDIYDLLNKSDNHEVIADGTDAAWENTESDEAAGLRAELDGMVKDAEKEQDMTSKWQKKALEKKQKKQEKVKAKQAAKEARKARKKTDRNLSEKDLSDMQELLAAAESSGKNEKEITVEDGDWNSADKVPGGADETRDAADMEQNAADAVQNASDEDLQELDELLNLAGISEMLDAEKAEDIPEKQEPEETLIVEPEKEKGGLFSRIIDFLTETEEDEEKGTEDIPLSEENKNILEEMDAEEQSGKKGKKSKKKKGKKAKENLDNPEEEETEKESGKRKKPKKEKKIKKEKTADNTPRGKLPVKAMLSIAAVCGSVLAVILLLSSQGSDFAAKREAKKAYYREDYETCYKELYGRNLNESEQVMFVKSECILRVRLRLKEYEIYANEQAETEALDVLIQTVHDYDRLSAYASEWNAGETVAAVYNRMLSILQDKYGLTEGEALEIAAEPDDVEYTRIVTQIASGGKYNSVNNAGDPEETVQLPDMLPEENKFSENIGG